MIFTIYLELVDLCLFERYMNLLFDHFEDCVWMLHLNVLKQVVTFKNMFLICSMIYSYVFWEHY